MAKSLSSFEALRCTIALGMALRAPPFRNMRLRLCSHTEGLCCMQVDLEGDGSFLFTSDQFHVKENYTKKIPQGKILKVLDL